MQAVSAFRGTSWKPGWFGFRLHRILAFRSLSSILNVNIHVSIAIRFLVLVFGQTHIVTMKLRPITCCNVWIMTQWNSCKTNTFAVDLDAREASDSSAYRGTSLNRNCWMNIIDSSPAPNWLISRWLNKAMSVTKYILHPSASAILFLVPAEHF